VKVVVSVLLVMTKFEKLDLFLTGKREDFLPHGIAFRLSLTFQITLVIMRYLYWLLVDYLMALLTKEPAN
jgi:hypothetical protein